MHPKDAKNMWKGWEQGLSEQRKPRGKALRWSEPAVFREPRGGRVAGSVGYEESLMQWGWRWKGTEARLRLTLEVRERSLDFV